MIINSLQDAKATLQSLTESLWIFSALCAFSESGTLAALINKVTIAQLQEITNLPKSVLNTMINLLKKY